MTRPRIFCVGLSRTGTSSLCRALSILGYKPLHGTFNPTFVSQVMSGNFALDGYDEFDAFADAPVAPFFREWDAFHPGSHFILTTRNNVGWLESIRYHFRDQSARNACGPDVLKTTTWELSIIRAAVYGTLRYDCERLLRVFHAHETAVRRYFWDSPERAARFTELNICDKNDGWGVLCNALKKPVPNLPFPSINPRPPRWREPAA